MLVPHLLKIYFGLGWPSSVLEIVSSRRLKTVHNGSLRFITVYYSLLRFLMVYYGFLRFITVYYGLILYICIPWVWIQKIYKPPPHLYICIPWVWIQKMSKIKQWILSLVSLLKYLLKIHLRHSAVLHLEKYKLSHIVWNHSIL